MKTLTNSTFLTIFPALLVFFRNIRGQDLTSGSNTVEISLTYPNDTTPHIYLGAIFPIHEPPLKGNDTCGAIKGEDGVLALESLLFSIDQINEAENILPGIKLGVVILDSCHSKTIALKQSLKFLKGFIASHNGNHHSDFICPNNTPAKFTGGRGYERIVGVIGGQQSSVSVQIANVLRLFNVPQISYRSTSSFLSEKDKFPYFLRTVPSDINQAGVILKVLEYINITYASLVYSNTEYGIGGYEELKKKSKYSSVCFATQAHALKKDDPQDKYLQVYDELLKREKARAIVLFADEATARRLLEVAKNHTKRRAFLWIGSDAWTSHSSFISDYSDIIEGAIGIQPMAWILPNFKEHFTSLNFNRNQINPWFGEYWENHFNCSIKKFSCRNKNLRTSNTFEDVDWVHFIRDAVYAFAHGLHDMWSRLCSNQTGTLCPEMIHDGHIHGEELYGYIKSTSFKDVTNNTFRFEASGSGTPRYTIFSYRKRFTSYLQSVWEPVANFSYVDNKPEMIVKNSARFFWRENQNNFPDSDCGKPCKKRQGRLPHPEDECCWQCVDCEYNQFLNNTTGLCETCEPCKLPDESGSTCVPKEEKYLDFQNKWAITSMGFAVVGIFSTVFVGLIFWVHIDTPVIKAASRELSYILLLGILISFLMTFAILAPPSPYSCGSTRFFLGFSYTLCYSAILTKTNRISRIFNKSPSKPCKAKYTSPRSQIVIVLLLVSVEIIINTCWLLYYPPDVTMECKSSEDYPYNILICKGIADHSYIVGFIYPLFLVLMCTIYAIKTRKCPGGFNEARYIAFTNYTTCIIWVVFVPLYLTTPAEEEVRTVSLAMSLALGGFVQLGCLFLPKVHIVIFKPEKNTRDAVMSQQKGSSFGPHNSIGKNIPHLSAPNMVYYSGAECPYPVQNDGTLQIKNNVSAPSTINLPKPDENTTNDLKAGCENPYFASQLSTNRNI